jgi:hypothetical protein
MSKVVVFTSVTLEGVATTTGVIIATYRTAEG